MKKKNKIIIISLLVGLILILAGVSYAYFAAVITGNESTSTIVLEAGELEIDVSGGNSIVANNLLPSANAWATKTITLTGKNTTNTAMNYILSIVVDNNTFSSGSIKYSLTGENVDNNGQLISNKTLQTLDSTLDVGTGYFVNGSNKVHRYTLSLYFPDTYEDQSDDMGATFNCHIVIKEQKSDFIFKDVILAKNTPDSASTKTVPGRNIATANEGLRSTTDDYGTSYYFRGNVQNNYVVFAKMCWRIVRIDGQGNVKLVLYNYNSDKTNITNPCASTYDGENNAFARVSGTTYTSAFNEDSSVYANNAGIGLMYGTPGSSSYTLEHANTNKSTILNNLETWYINNLGENAEKDYTNYLADVIWCNDKSFASNNTGTGTGTLTTD